MSSCPTTTDNKDTNDNESDIGFDAEFVKEKARALYKGIGLAPMVRASTIPLRTQALKYGADFVYTEELIDRSITDTIRIPTNPALGTIDYIKDTTKLSKKVQRRLARENYRTALLLRIDPRLEKNKLICQLGTGEPDLALAAARHVCRDVAAIDINMGCPKKFSVSGGMGSALLSDPDRACRIIRTLRECPELRRLPISAKIRLLKDDTPASTVGFIDALVEAGANAVAIHARRVGDDCINPARWDELRAVLKIARKRHPDLPLLVNGDFYTLPEWHAFQNETGADGVLLARPALYNTSIFCRAAVPTTTTNNHQDDNKKNHQNNNTATMTAIDSYETYTRLFPIDKTTVICDYLRECLRYDTHYKNVKYVICEMMNNRRAPTVRVPFLEQHFPGGQTIATTCQCQTLPEICGVWNTEYTPYNNNNNDNNKQEQEQQLQGEHKYDDDYFLKHEKKKNNNNKKEESSAQGTTTTTTTEETTTSTTTAATMTPNSAANPTTGATDAAAADTTGATNSMTTSAGKGDNNDNNNIHHHRDENHDHNHRNHHNSNNNPNKRIRVG